MGLELDLDLGLVADRKAHRMPRMRWGCTMASPTRLHIGRPCHLSCTPRALDGPWAGGSVLGPPSLVPCPALSQHQPHNRGTLTAHPTPIPRQNQRGLWSGRTHPPDR